MKIQRKQYEIKYSQHQIRSHSLGYIPWQFLSKPDKDGFVESIAGRHTCREGFLSSLIDQFNEDKHEYGIPTDRLRMHIWENVSSNFKSVNHDKPMEFVGKRTEELPKVEENFTRLTRFMLKILHMLEKEADWLKTKAYRVIDPEWEDSHISYMLEASRRWMKAPYLLSTYCLILRSCSIAMRGAKQCGFDSPDALIEGIKSPKDYFDALEELDRKKGSNNYVTKSYPYWQLILKSYPEIWEKRKMEYYWDMDRFSGATRYPSHEGIQKLIMGKAADPDVKNKFAKILKKEGMKHANDAY